MATTRDFEARLAKLSDVESIALMVQDASRWFGTKGINQWSGGAFIQEILQEIKNNELLVIEVGGEVIGTVAIGGKADELWENSPDEAAYMHRLVIKREWAGQGFGRRIIEWVEAELKNSGKSLLRLVCDAKNDVLQTYYRNLDFDSCGVKHFAPYDMDFIRFEKRLNMNYLPGSNQC